jgi:uncharacterized protein YbbK (DUF523 family)
VGQSEHDHERQDEGAILVSACLADIECRYDGTSKPRAGIHRLLADGRVLPLCPEVAGGMGVPREPASIVGGDGFDVLDGRARVVTRSGRDVTAEFVRGAEAVLQLAQQQNVKQAILKQRSPSCGHGQLASPHGPVPGSGVLAALLERHGIHVMSDEEWNSTTP